MPLCRLITHWPCLSCVSLTLCRRLQQVSSLQHVIWSKPATEKGEFAAGPFPFGHQTHAICFFVSSDPCNLNAPSLSSPPPLPNFSAGDREWLAHAKQVSCRAGDLPRSELLPGKKKPPCPSVRLSSLKPSSLLSPALSLSLSGAFDTQKIAGL